MSRFWRGIAAALILVLLVACGGPQPASLSATPMPKVESLPVPTEESLPVPTEEPLLVPETDTLPAPTAMHTPEAAPSATAQPTLQPTPSPTAAPTATALPTPTASPSPEAAPAEAGPREYPVTIIPLSGPLAEPDAEVSGMTWYGEYLILLPQYPDFGGGGEFVYALPRADIVAYLDGDSTGSLAPVAVPFQAPGLAGTIAGFEGYEAIAFDGERAYLTIEASPAGGMRGYLVAGTMVPELSGLVVDTGTVTEIPPQSGAGNKADEALLVAGDKVVTLYEVNGANLNPEPVAHRFAASLAPDGTLPFPNVEYRITDATALDEAGRFWASNFFFPLDQEQMTDSDPLVERYGQGPTHTRSPVVERLVEFQYSEGAITLVDGPPIQLELLPLAAHNWEGVARLEGQGLLLVTDQFPGTILGFVSLPTVAVCPAPGGERPALDAGAPGSSGSGTTPTEIFEPQIANYLNVTGSHEGLEEALGALTLSDGGGVWQARAQVLNADLTGDGVPEVVLDLSFFQPGQYAEGALYVYGCRDGRYEGGVVATMGGQVFSEEGPDPGIRAVQDMNGDSRPEIVFSYIEVIGTHGNFGRIFRILGRDGAEYRDLIQSDGQPANGARVLNGDGAVRDVDGDGLLELVLANGPGQDSAGGTPEPATTDVWAWDGTVFRLAYQIEE